MALTNVSSLPPGSLVLVTGVNGFMASVIADECVQHGYRTFPHSQEMLKM